MKKPVEPQKPWEPLKPYFSTQVREQVGPVDEDEDGHYIDEPCYPDITIPFIEAWAAKNGIDDPRKVTVSFYPGSHEWELTIEGHRTITPEMRAEADREYAEKMKHYREVELPAYDAALEQYQEDMRAYYKWKHDNV